MALSPFDPSVVFSKHLPVAFLEASVSCLVDSYSTSWAECDAAHQKPEAHDLWPYARRAKFEGEWRSLAKGFESISASVELNYSKNWHHTRIQGGPVILTASAVRDEAEIVRYAVFRETLARSNQAYLFDDIMPPPLPDAPLYAILIHAPSLETPSRPRFAHVVFPSPDAKGYVGRIRLELQFPKYFAPTENDIEEKVADIAIPELYPDVTKRSKKSL